MVDHVGRDADERGDPDAVAQNGGPERIHVVKELHLRRKGQETANNELPTNTQIQYKHLGTFSQQSLISF